MTKKFFWSAVAAGVVLFAIVMLPTWLGVHAGDPTKDACIRHKGYGQWVGSSGVTLDEFCGAAAGLTRMQQDRRDHPENY